MTTTSASITFDEIETDYKKPVLENNTFEELPVSNQVSNMLFNNVGQYGARDDLNINTNKKFGNQNCPKESLIFPETDPRILSHASIDDDWTSDMIDNRELVKSYKDRLGRQQNIVFEKPPPANQMAKHIRQSRSLDTFTGTGFIKKKGDASNLEPICEENTQYIQAKVSSQSVNRNSINLNTNKSHLQCFSGKETSRDGYDGYNLKSGHETRAQKLIDTNRSHYKTFDGQIKQFNMDGCSQVNVEPSSKPHKSVFARSASLGGGIVACDPTRPIPLLKDAEVAVKGRLFQQGSEIDNCYKKPTKSRTIKHEVSAYKSSIEMKGVDTNCSVSHPNVSKPNRNDTSENTVVVKSETGIESCILNPESVPQNSQRSETFKNGKLNLPFSDCASVTPVKERLDGEEDEELKLIFVDQQLDSCGIRSNTILGKDRSVTITNQGNKKLPDSECIKPNMYPTNRLPEKETINTEIKSKNIPDKLKTYPRQNLGSKDGKNNSTVLNTANTECDLIHVPKERISSDTSFSINSMRNNGFDIKHCQLPKTTAPKSVGSSDITGHLKRSVNAFSSSHVACRPSSYENKNVGSVSNPNMGAKGNIDNDCFNIQPEMKLKEQRVSGSKRLLHPVIHLQSECRVPQIHEKVVTKQELKEQNRLGSNLMTQTDVCGLQPVTFEESNSVRGSFDDVRMNSEALGSRVVHRDVSVRTCENDYKSDTIREVPSRTGSAMSFTSFNNNLCVPKRESGHERGEVESRAPSAMSDACGAVKHSIDY